MNLAFLIAIGAGIASAVLYASAWTGTALGMFVLFFLSPVPVAIAGLGWGWAAGAIAAITGAATIAVTGGGRSGIVYMIALGAPAAVFSYLALLNRQAPDGTIEWYPIGRILAWASLWAGLTAGAALLGIGSDAEGVRKAMQEMLDRMMLLDGAGPGSGKLTPDQKLNFAQLMTAFLPWAIATVWFAVAMLNLWIAALVTRRSGRLTRPWPDLSSTTLPPGMPIAFAVAVGASLMGEMTGLIAAGFASALVFAFMLVGLGLIHRATRGYPIRPFALGVLYAGLVLMPPFSTLIVALLGLAEPFLRGRLPPAVPPT